MQRTRNIRIRNIFPSAVFDLNAIGYGPDLSRYNHPDHRGSDRPLASYRLFNSLGHVHVFLYARASGLFLILFALSGSMAPALFYLLFVGSGSSMYMTLNNTLVMSNTHDELIGRVMSIYMMTFGLVPLAMLTAGALAEVFGAPFTVAGGGLFSVLFLVAVTIFQPRIRQLR